MINTTTQTIFILFLSIPLFGQTTDKQLTSYLRKNSAEIDFRLKFKPLEQKLKASSFIAIGETHGTDLSYEVLNIMINKVSQLSPIDYFLIEFDYSSSFFLNEFLKRGEQKDLDLVFSHFDGTFYFNTSIVNSFKKLRENIALQNMKTVGVDIYHVPVIGFKHLKILLKDQELNESILPNFKTLLSLPDDSIRYRNADFISLLQSSLHEIKNHNERLKKQWGNNFSEIHYILNAMDLTYKIKTSEEEKQDSLRDNQMFENFKDLSELIGIKPSHKLIFSGGREHVIKAELPNTKKFAHLMEKHLYKDKTLAIVMFYTNSMFMIPNEQFGIEGEGVFSEKNFFNDDGPFFQIDGIALLKEVSRDKSLTIFDLNGRKSPFKTENIFTKEYSSSNSTNQFYDFIILIKNSKATKPYNK